MNYRIRQYVKLYKRTKHVATKRRAFGKILDWIIKECEL